jgi:hypothetical protein
MIALQAVKARRFKGFAVIERPDGPLIWGTFRPTEDAARAAFTRWNPAVQGHESGAQIIAVEITFRAKFD